MSAPDLLVVIDPVARLTDGESVRIARDVLCAGAPGTKVCLPEEPEDVLRALARRGSRRLVVVGDDRALLRTVQLLHRERELAGCALAVVPVGPPGATALARALGIPGTAVDASRAVLGGTDCPMDLLVDDSGGVVLGALRVPAGSQGDGARGARGRRAYGRGGGVGAYGREAGSVGEREGRDGREEREERAAHPADGPDGQRDRGDRSDRGDRDRDDRGGAADPERAPLGTGDGRSAAGPGGGVGAAGTVWASPLRGCRSLVRTLTRPLTRPLPLLAALAAPGGGRGGAAGDAPQRLRVEADGTVLADLDRPVAQVSLAPGDGGFAEVVVRQRASGTPVRARARTVTVSGPDFRYRADAVVGGPVRARTWTALESAWSLTLPGQR